MLMNEQEQIEWMAVASVDVDKTQLVNTLVCARNREELALHQLIVLHDRIRRLSIPLCNAILNAGNTVIRA
jgi:hypothetical protein